jgi:hypothetical protein
MPFPTSKRRRLRKCKHEEESFEAVIGNSYLYLRSYDRRVPNDPYRFACFVKVSDPEKVEEVEFGLHHEFGAPNPVVVKSPPFIMPERDAYDKFTVTAKIVFEVGLRISKRECRYRTHISFV